MIERRPQWAPWERATVQLLREQGLSYREIGERFNRTAEGVRKVATRPRGARCKWR